MGQEVVELKQVRQKSDLSVKPPLKGHSMRRQKQPTVTIIPERMTEEGLRRFEAAADLLIGEIVQRVLEEQETTSNASAESTRQEIHRTDPLQ